VSLPGRSIIKLSILHFIRLHQLRLQIPTSQAPLLSRAQLKAILQLSHSLPTFSRPRINGSTLSLSLTRLSPPPSKRPYCPRWYQFLPSKEPRNESVNLSYYCILTPPHLISTFSTRTHRQLLHENDLNLSRHAQRCTRLYNDQLYSYRHESKQYLIDLCLLQPRPSL